MIRHSEIPCQSLCNRCGMLGFTDAAVLLTALAYIYGRPETAPCWQPQTTPDAASPDDAFCGEDGKDEGSGVRRLLGGIVTGQCRDGRRLRRRQPGRRLGREDRLPVLGRSRDFCSGRYPK